MTSAVLYLRGGGQLIVWLPDDDNIDPMEYDGIYNFEVCNMDPRLQSRDMVRVHCKRIEAIMVFDFDDHRSAWLEDRGLHVDAQRAAAEVNRAVSGVFGGQTEGGIQ